MSRQKIVYLARAEASEQQVKALAEAQLCTNYYLIERRGTELGWIGEIAGQSPDQEVAALWNDAEAIFFPKCLTDTLDHYEADMEKSYALVEGVLDGETLIALMEEHGFFDRLSAAFQFLGGFSDESDRQGIEQLEFEAIEDGQLVADNLWMKASWLSFDDEDASLRFRFSYGKEGIEDVAKDFRREQITANLAQGIFPESAAITENPQLKSTIGAASGIKQPAFVERIYYFNAPNGGAQFHHDVERGHAGVVYAQMFGSTAWLALSKQRLLDELIEFLSSTDNQTLLDHYFDSAEVTRIVRNVADRAWWSALMDDREEELIEIVLNLIPQFFARLVERGNAHILHAGDVLLLPQANLQHCCWHTVFCLDDFPGEAMSFAIRESRPVDA